MGGILPRPVTAIHIERRSTSKFGIGLAEMQGWRLEHEDSHTIMPDWGQNGQEAFFAIFDGHAGDTVSDALSKNLHKVLAKHVDAEKSAASIETAFLAMDASLKTQKLTSGSTCAAAIVNCEKGKYSIRIINLGDSRVLVFKLNGGGQHEEGKPCLSLIGNTEDHKPDAPEEIARITAAGGYVTKEEPPRLDGAMALSRMFGDFEFKKDPLLDVRKQKAIAIPDCMTVEAQEGDLLVLACDGLFEVVDNHQLGELIEEFWPSEGKVDLGKVASQVIDECLKKDSKDNMSLMLVKLQSGPEEETKDEMVLNSYAKECEDSKDKKVSADPPAASNPLVRLLGGDDKTNMVDKYHTFFRKAGFSPAPLPCMSCGRVFRAMFRCPCKEAQYCSQPCQKQGWKEHKPLCSVAQQAKKKK